MARSEGDDGSRAPSQHVRASDSLARLLAAQGVSSTAPPRPAAAATPAPAKVRATSDKRTRRESAARVLTLLSAALLAAAVAFGGGQLWRRAQQPPPPPPALAPTTAAVFLVERGRLELSADRRTLVRRELAGERWRLPLPAPLDELAATAPLAVGRAAETLHAIELERGLLRWSWRLPAEEQWGPAPPLAHEHCLAVRTTRRGRVTVRCLAPDRGDERWVVALPRGLDCTAPTQAIPDALIVPCQGWAAVLDVRTGALTTEAGALGLARQHPPALLRLSHAGDRLVTAPWSARRRAFVRTGSLRFAADGVGDATSAVLYDRGLLVRGSDAGEGLASLLAPGKPSHHIFAPELRLAEATPLVRECGGGTPPRFQLLELAPRLGASFDPTTSELRALALLDTERGQLAWTSHASGGLRRRGAPAAPVCKDGYLFAALELDGPDLESAPQLVLWIIDARTGKTAAALALPRSLGELGPEQVDGERLVASNVGQVFELPWRRADEASKRGAAHLERVLGALP